METRKNGAAKVMAILIACACGLAFLAYFLPMVSISSRYEWSGFELIERLEEDAALLILALLCTLQGIAFGLIGLKARKIAIGGIISAAFALIFMIAFFADRNVDLDVLGMGALLYFVAELAVIPFSIVALASRGKVVAPGYDAPVVERRCTGCGMPLENNAAFCKYCGTAVVVEPVAPAVAYCSACGAQLAEDAAFCTNCGTPKA